MENTAIFEKDDAQIIDTVEYNGKYTDVKTIRNKILSCGAVFLAIAAFIVGRFILI